MSGIIVMSREKRNSRRATAGGRRIFLSLKFLSSPLLYSTIRILSFIHSRLSLVYSILLSFSIFLSMSLSSLRPVSSSRFGFSPLLNFNSALALNRVGKKFRSSGENFSPPENSKKKK